MLLIEVSIDCVIRGCSSRDSFKFGVVKPGVSADVAGAVASTAQTLLAAVANKRRFTKDDALHALKNTSARRVDRALAALVKDGHLRKYAAVLAAFAPRFHACAVAVMLLLERDMLESAEVVKQVSQDVLGNARELAAVSSALCCNRMANAWELCPCGHTAPVYYTHDVHVCICSHCNGGRCSCRVGTAGEYEVVGNKAPNGARLSTPPTDKKSLQAGRMRRRDGKTARGRPKDVVLYCSGSDIFVS